MTWVKKCTIPVYHTDETLVILHSPTHLTLKDYWWLSYQIILFCSISTVLFSRASRRVYSDYWKNCQDFNWSKLEQRANQNAPILGCIYDTFVGVVNWVFLINVAFSLLIFQIISVIYVGLLLFESFPWHVVLLGLVANIVYYMLLNDFPYISFTSPVFLLSVGVYLHFFT